jgi:hypothetical protein
MKRIGFGFLLALIVSLAVSSMAMAAGPSTNGYGADPMGEQPPNDVYVPLKAFEARGGELPPNPDSNGALFYVPGPPK